MKKWFMFGWLAVSAMACSDTAGPTSTRSTSPTNPIGGNPGADVGASSGMPGAVDVNVFASGTELRVPVAATGRVFVSLASPAVVPIEKDAAATSTAWDLAFEGFDAFTNSGLSGGGKAASFGPLEGTTFTGDVAPTVPFLMNDKAGGAFADWYFYEGGESHLLWSRYHALGVRDGARTWKVQVLSYYGQRDGATVAGLYSIRYTELTAQGGEGETHELANIDGTAGGATAPANAPSACIDFGTGERIMLSPDAARASSAWHLCFRRATITVNGERGGPRGITAVDLDASATAAETLVQVRARTAESEKARFAALTASAFDGKSFRGDRIVSGFSEAWIDNTKSPIAPAFATWIAVDASGEKKYFVGFTAFEAPTASSPGTLVLRVKPVK